MSVFSLLKAKPGTVALVAAACAAVLALPQSIPHAEAMPLTGAHQAYTAGPNPVVHNIRVVRKSRANKPRKRVGSTKCRGICIGSPSRVQAKGGSPTRKVVVINGKRVVRRIGPVIHDHRRPLPPDIRTPRQPYVGAPIRRDGPLIRDHRRPLPPNIRTPRQPYSVRRR